jgi:V/A-type H+-transporting ATPase subunit I
MAIVPLDKLTLLGTQDQKETVLEGLQRLGCLHLVDLGGRRDAGLADTLISKPAREALNYLRACPIRRRQTKRRRGYDFQQIDTEALRLKHRQQELEDERDHLVKAIQDVEPWGDFHVPPAEELGGTRLWPFVLAHGELADLAETDQRWQVVSKDAQFEYVMVLSAEPPEGVPGTRVELDPRPLSELRVRLEDIEEELEELHWQRVSLTRWCTLLARDLDEADDQAARQAAARRMLERDNVFALRAWAPREATDEIRRFAERHGLAVRVEPASASDSPPTLLKNPERVAGAEGAVTFYITPDYHAWDPTAIVYYSFSLFFAMIVADAGYGLIFAAALWVFWKKLGRSPAGVRARNFLSAVVLTTVLYGVLAGSYFGLSAPPLLAPLQVFDLQDQGGMMALAIVIGVAHLVLANLVAAWQSRTTIRCLVPIGWAAIMLCGLVLGAAVTGPLPFLDRLAARLGISPGGLYGWLQSLGTLGLVAGGLAVFLFSSQRPLFSTRISDWVFRVLDGLQGLTGITKAFGDVLSYLRLFALGLASAQLAATFNNMAGGALELPGPGVLLAVLILLVGHGINIVLGIMSGVVHGLRLNCIEFFNWSLKEEGHPFQAFRKKAGV